MKKLSFITIFFAYFTLQSAYATLTPNGFWKTIDDVSGKPRAILHISETPNKTFAGRIVKTFPGPGENHNDICTACQGERHNKHILGMVILENLKQNQNNINEWTGGQILDPKSGKIYHCSLKVVENGQKLRVRGYIGLPLFGRSQTWIRVTSPDEYAAKK